nr:NADH dehydrogenase subunit 6 [Lepidostoma basale]UOU85055.1 NADH dehydrogenase subunit 6 [Lepidostoma basale]
MIFYLIITMNFLILSLSHPLIITIAMLFQTLMMSLMIGLMSFSFWLTYLMFLIFIGGLLILFIYVSSLTPNKLFFWNKSNIISIFCSTLFLIIIFMKMSIFFNNMEMINWDNFNNFFFNNENSFYISNLFNDNEMFLTLILMFYLILTLIVTTNISNSFKGPLRESF